jgi:hypothetical protein
MAEGLLSHFGYKLWLELYPRSLVSSPVSAAEFTTHRFFLSELAKGEINDDRPRAKSVPGPYIVPNNNLTVACVCWGALKSSSQLTSRQLLQNFLLYTPSDEIISAATHVQNEKSRARTYTLTAGICSERACLSSMYICIINFLAARCRWYGDDLVPQLVNVLPYWLPTLFLLLQGPDELDGIYRRAHPL